MAEAAFHLSYIFLIDDLFQFNSFFSFGLVTGHILSKGKSSLDLLGCWTTLVGRDKRFDSLYEVLDSASKGGSPNLLCLMQNKLNLLISGFASVLEPLWKPKTKDPYLFATYLSVHARLY